MSDLIYEAAVYSRTVKYKNHLGEVKEETFDFMLDPMALLSVINKMAPKAASKSGNPAKRNAEPEYEFDIEMIKTLATKAAGYFSPDGEQWMPDEDFATRLSGKAFLTKLASSDGDRKEFAEKVILDPFRTFVAYTREDPSNTKQDIQMFERMLSQLENVFKMPVAPEGETLEERRARLAKELKSLEAIENPDE